MLFFSQATPNLAIVIPAMDHIDHQLQTFAQDQKYLLSVRAAISLARKTLNHYYLLMDNSKVYQITMSEHLSSMTVNLLTAHPSIVLHPCHKLTYFKNMDWEANWISQQKDLCKASSKLPTWPSNTLIIWKTWRTIATNVPTRSPTFLIPSWPLPHLR